ncbi:hypothetical protein [Kordiimonas sp. SCSIO 12610]|uniref:hypothetical protein n=1 Tax=Kordiimonas sp. SCSIO 12610 TaxID=2829597 RepID=UPI00210A7627|nr:hypothetical protein [Kordiimonas sp. SCSIO 12610]UTW54102.1 hypothetical protein KFF44_09680 [Kordiimonas sp. SCSIO 12610]
MQRPLSFIAILFILIFSSPNLQADIDEARAIKYLEEVQKICRADEEKLWGIDFCRHTLFIDPSDRSVLGYDLRRNGPIDPSKFTRGYWPDDRPISNTTRFWKRRQWATIVWPPRGDSVRRSALILHENFHGIQGILPFRVGRPLNTNHLDDLPGRMSLRMEVAVLAKAIVEDDAEARRELAQLAYEIRTKRLAGDERAVRAERYWQLYEGIPEYTGHKLTKAGDEFARFIADRMPDLVARETYAHDFAYFTTPAWGILLDKDNPGWRQKFTGRLDLADTYADALRIDKRTISDDEFARLSAPYGYTEAMAFETTRQEVLDAERAGYRARFVEGKVLVLTASGFRMDPSTMVSLGSDGRVFQEMEISDDWGSLYATGGAMMGPRPPWIYVEAVEENGNLVLKNDKWELELNPGWKIVGHERGYTVSR